VTVPKRKKAPRAKPARKTQAPRTGARTSEGHGPRRGTRRTHAAAHRPRTQAAAAGRRQAAHRVSPRASRGRWLPRGGDQYQPG
jgi:hypothetical protein